MGITGATGAVYGVKVLEAIRETPGFESHVVLSEAGALNLWHELRMRRKELEKLADAAYHPNDIAAAIERVQASLGARGRVVLRPSGTEPLIRVMVEGEDAEAVGRHADELAAAVRAAAPA